MVTSNEVLTRTFQFIPSDRPVAVADLRRLYQEDPELLFELCTIGLPAHAGLGALGLQSLARTVAILSRDGFELISRSGEHIAEGTQGGYLALESATADRAFLEMLYAGIGRPKSTAGAEISRARMDFYLADFPWQDAVRQTHLLRLAPQDASAVLSGVPHHQYYELIDCAREIIRAPYRVWSGIREKGERNWGRAYCGRPSRRWMNFGTSAQPLDGFVYVVYTDSDGMVFDWDWIKADEVDPQLPANYTQRFGSLIESPEPAELIVGNIRGQVTAAFKAGQTCYSVTGDCVFCYFDDRESYATRVDDYLTGFLPLEGQEQPSVGFKLKYVSRLFETVSKWAKTNDEHILVEFDPDTVSVKVFFLMQAWLTQNLPLTEELRPAMELMQLMQRVQQAGNPKVNLPRSVLQEA